MLRSNRLPAPKTETIPPMPQPTALALLLLPCTLWAAGPATDPNTAKVDLATGVHWYDIRSLGVEGQ